MHRLATVDFFEKLNTTMRKYANTLSRQLIKAEEKAMENLLAKAADILIDYTANEVELKAISELTNLRTKSLA